MDTNVCDLNSCVPVCIEFVHRISIEMMPVLVAIPLPVLSEFPDVIGNVWQLTDRSLPEELCDWAYK
jgi:hypothetical protein